MKGNSPVLSECDVNEKSWQLMRNNVAEVDANQSSPHHHQFQSNHMITRLRFAYVSLAFMVFFSRMQNRLKTWSTIENRDSTLYTIIYSLTLGISFLLFFFFFPLKLDLPSVPPSSNQWNVASEMAKPVQPAVLPENGRGELPDERDNEIVIELDRENQYGRTQPRANEPQGNHLRNIQMVHPHLMSRHIFFPRFFCSLVSRSHTFHFPTHAFNHPIGCIQGIQVFPRQTFFHVCSMAINEIKKIVV